MISPLYRLETIVCSYHVSHAKPTPPLCQSQAANIPPGSGLLVDESLFLTIANKYRVRCSFEFEALKQEYVLCSQGICSFRHYISFEEPKDQPAPAIGLLLNIIQLFGPVFPPVCPYDGDTKQPGATPVKSSVLAEFMRGCSV